MRLRIIDLNTPWFWLTAFYFGKRYGKPSFELAIWPPHTWQRWWLNVWKREAIPVETGAYASPEERLKEGR